MRIPLLVVLTVLSPVLSGQAAPKPPLPVTGRLVAGMESFDDLMISFITKHRVPGGTLAVVRGGRIVYARGFGYADPSTGEKMRPDSLFRIASVSKPITAAAVMRLVEDKKLSLDDRVLDILKLKPTGKRKVDPRLKKVTVRQLLVHTAGWDNRKSFDPMFRPVKIAKALGVPPPAGARDVVRYMLGVPLDFDPGSRHAYSNFGYCLLGRIIEARSRMTYERYVRRRVLAPAGITRMRIARSLRAGRADGEVTYHTRDRRKRPGVFPPNVGKRTPEQYGGVHIEAMDAHGGWIASAIDLVRFAREFDSPEACRFLSARSVARTFARPDGPAGFTKDGKPKAAYYALGWSVRPVGKDGKVNTWHCGAIAGTNALLVRRHDGTDWAVLFNMDTTAKGRYLVYEIDPLVHRAADAVRKWPGTDLLKAGLLGPAVESNKVLIQ